MKKIVFCIGITIAFRTISNAQPTAIGEQAGIKVSYEAAKLEEDKKHDKWKVTVTIDNDAPQDVVFLGSPEIDPVSKAANAPRYLKVEVTNSKGLFTVSFKEFRGENTPYLASDGSSVFRAHKGRIVESFNTNVEKGATPELKAIFMANVQPMSGVSLLIVNPAEATASQNRTFLVYQGGNYSSPREDGTLRFLSWDNMPVSAIFNGSRFSVSANGDFTNAQMVETINFLGWDRSRMTARVDNNNNFVIFRNGDFSAPLQESQINYMGSDGYNLSARLKPFVTNRLAPGERLFPGQRRVSNNGVYSLAMQFDGNLVLYNGQQPLWSSGSNNKPARECIMQTDGNLVVYEQNGVAIWSSATSGGGNYLLVQDDGNLVLYHGDGNGAWSTRTKGR